MADELEQATIVEFDVPSAEEQLESLRTSWMQQSSYYQAEIERLRKQRKLRYKFLDLILMLRVAWAYRKGPMG